MGLIIIFVLDDIVFKVRSYIDEVGFAFSDDCVGEMVELLHQFNLFPSSSDDEVHQRIPQPWLHLRANWEISHMQ